MLAQIWEHGYSLSCMKLDRWMMFNDEQRRIHAIACKAFQSNQLRVPDTVFVVQNDTNLFLWSPRVFK